MVSGRSQHVANPGRLGTLVHGELLRAAHHFGDWNLTRKVYSENKSALKGMCHYSF
jgi:hypothetical protein